MESFLREALRSACRAPFPVTTSRGRRCTRSAGTTDFPIGFYGTQQDGGVVGTRSRGDLGENHAVRLFSFRDGRPASWHQTLPIPNIHRGAPPHHDLTRHRTRSEATKRNREAPIADARCRERTGSGSAKLHMALTAIFDSGLPFAGGADTLSSELPGEIAIDSVAQFRDSNQARGAHS
jgi:hypothetical protein